MAAPQPRQPQPLMPHATATWLVENTALTFQQIADFCQIHVLEVQAIADETTATKLTPRDPVRAGELSLAEIEKAEADPAYRMVITPGPAQQRRTSGPRYTPIAKRQDKPDGIAWILRHHPEVSDAQIAKLIGTTKATIAAIRNREHWNIANISPKDPVTLGLCSQRELDLVIAAAAKKAGLAEATDTRLSQDRQAMLERLRAEREAAQRADAETRTPFDPNSLFRG
ncbi:cell cycle transcriptional regulator TrcR [Thermaurantiacus sp.]